jgi:hypothetical protein
MYYYIHVARSKIAESWCGGAETKIAKRANTVIVKSINIMEVAKYFLVLPIPIKK